VFSPTMYTLVLFLSLKEFLKVLSLALYYFLFLLMTSLILFFHIHAEDVQIYLSGSKEHIVSLVNLINTDLATIADWSTRNGLCLNSQKSQAMAISQQNPLSLPPVKVDDPAFPFLTKFVRSKKFNLFFSNHMINDLSKMWSIISRFSRSL
jgi:hypothetical protein